MIKVKHFMDEAEPDDGTRIWVEPFGLTRDLCDWCHVNYIVVDVAPPRELWDWFEDHPQAYELFRGCYHTHLEHAGVRADLQTLANAARHENVTLLHQSEDPERNSAMALYEFLSELNAYCPPDG